MAQAAHVHGSAPPPPPPTPTPALEHPRSSRGNITNFLLLEHTFPIVCCWENRILSIGEQPGRVKSERVFLLKGACALGEGWRAWSHLTRAPCLVGVGGGGGGVVSLKCLRRETPRSLVRRSERDIPHYSQSLLPSFLPFWSTLSSPCPPPPPAWTEPQQTSVCCLFIRLLSG